MILSKSCTYSIVCEWLVCKERIVVEATRVHQFVGVLRTPMLHCGNFCSPKSVRIVLKRANQMMD